MDAKTLFFVDKQKVDGPKTNVRQTCSSRAGQRPDQRRSRPGRFLCLFPARLITLPKACAHHYTQDFSAANSPQFPNTGSNNHNMVGVGGS